MDDLTRRLVEVLEQVLQETVDAPTYPDGPCLDADTRKSIRALIHEAESQGDGWIKVTDRLPDFDACETIDDGEAIYVNVVRAERPTLVIPAVYLRSGNFMRRMGYSDYGWMGPQDVTNWRPLPTPPVGQ